MRRKHSAARRNYDQFVRGYVETALWSSNDNADDSGGEPLDANYTIDDIATSSMKSMKRDCAKFMKANKHALAEYVDKVEGSDDPWFSAGHDFWLTRNGHGAGFWDRSGVGTGKLHGNDLGSRLTTACKKFGSSDIYVSDGQVYVSPER